MLYKLFGSLYKLELFHNCIVFKNILYKKQDKIEV